MTVRVKFGSASSTLAGRSSDPLTSTFSELFSPDNGASSHLALTTPSFSCMLVKDCAAWPYTSCQVKRIRSASQKCGGLKLDAHTFENKAVLPLARGPTRRRVRVALRAFLIEMGLADFGENKAIRRKTRRTTSESKTRIQLNDAGASSDSTSGVGRICDIGQVTAKAEKPGWDRTRNLDLCSTTARLPASRNAPLRYDKVARMQGYASGSREPSLAEYSARSDWCWRRYRIRSTVKRSGKGQDGPRNPYVPADKIARGITEASMRL